MAARSAGISLLGLLGWAAPTFTVAWLGSIASRSAGDFYLRLHRPEWAPPAEWFAPVWTVLYVLMALAAWLVWRERGLAQARFALGLYLVHLVFNALWSWLFFRWRLGAVATLEIAILWSMIGTLVQAFWRVRPLAGALLLPYFAWVTFATALCYTTWQMNSIALGR